MRYSIYDFLGNLGVLLIIGSYLLLQLDKIKSSSFLFSLSNALGAGLILISLMAEFNLSAFIVEIFWLVISALGLFRFFSKRKMSKNIN